MKEKPTVFSLFLGVSPSGRFQKAVKDVSVISLFTVFVSVNGTSEFRKILKLLLIKKTVTDITNYLYICLHMKLMFICDLGLCLYHSSHRKVIKFTEFLSVCVSNTVCIND